MSAPTKLYQKIAEEVAQYIQSGRYALGEKLPAEQKLCAEFGASRNTIREALIILECLGYVQITQGRGVVVVRSALEGALPFHDSEVGAFALLEARRLIEGEACALAASAIQPAEIAQLEHLLAEMGSPDREASERADREFHMVIAKASGNEVIAATIENLWTWRYKSSVTRRLLVDAHVVEVQPRTADHRQILDALKTGSASASRLAMRDHLDKVVEHVLKVAETAAMQRLQATNDLRRSAITQRTKLVDEA